MNKEEIIKILSKIKDTVGENNYKETQDIWYIKILRKYKEIVEETHEIQNK